MLKELCEGLNELIFPNNCLLCRTHLETADPTRILCPFCLDGIQRNRPPFFPDLHRRTFDFDRAFSACLYNDTMQALIYRFKYGQKLALRHLFARLMAEFVENFHIDLSRYDLLVPIPLYPTRLRERGYNQAELLARELQKKFNIPLSSNTLKRTRATAFQSGLSQKDRWTNIQGAFKINQLTGIPGKNILLVDDLITTGATSSQAAAVLKKAGAAGISVFTLALTDTKDHG